jgi:hypothetical protein
MDGVQVGQAIEGRRGGVTPDFEVLREVRIDAVGNSAEFASAGNVSQVTQSGTNDFHGTATYIFGNGALNARNARARSAPTTARASSGPCSSRTSGRSGRA